MLEIESFKKVKTFKINYWILQFNFIFFIFLSMTAKKHQSV